MKITIYTISDCVFCKQEKDYLTSHNVAYEEKNLETNKDFLTEMLAVSNNFAGTPVTKIEKDDGQITVLKGFTKEDFDQALNITPVVAAPTEQPVAPAIQTAEASMSMPSDTAVAPTIPVPTPPAPEPTITANIPEPTQPPVMQPLEPVQPVPMQPAIEDQNKIQTELNQTAEAVLKTEPPVVEQPATPTVQTAEASMTMPPTIVSPAPTVDTEKLNGILQNLQNNATASTPTPTAPAPFPAQNATGGMPQIPEPDFH